MASESWWTVIVTTSTGFPPTFETFAKTFLKISGTQNKPSAIEPNESILRVLLTPAFGRKALDGIGFADIQEYVASKTRAGLSKKSINNHITVLRRLLVVAKKRGLIDAVPEIASLKAPKPEFDFLDCAEVQRLIDDADEEWRPMVVVVSRRGFGRGSCWRCGGGRTSI